MRAQGNDAILDIINTLVVSLGAFLCSVRLHEQVVSVSHFYPLVSFPSLHNFRDGILMEDVVILVGNVRIIINIENGDIGCILGNRQMANLPSSIFVLSGMCQGHIDTTFGTASKSLALISLTKEEFTGIVSV